MFFFFYEEMAVGFHFGILKLILGMGYLSKNYFGIFKKIIQGYGMYGVNYFGIWDIGYPLCKPQKWIPWHSCLVTVNSTALVIIRIVLLSLQFTFACCLKSFTSSIFIPPLQYFIQIIHLTFFTTKLKGLSHNQIVSDKTAIRFIIIVISSDNSLQ